MGEGADIRQAIEELAVATGALLIAPKDAFVHRRAFDALNGFFRALGEASDDSAGAALCYSCGKRPSAGKRRLGINPDGSTLYVHGCEKCAEEYGHELVRPDDESSDGAPGPRENTGGTERAGREPVHTSSDDAGADAGNERSNTRKAERTGAVIDPASAPDVGDSVRRTTTHRTAEGVEVEHTRYEPKRCLHHEVRSVIPSFGGVAWACMECMEPFAPAPSRTADGEMDVRDVRLREALEWFARLEDDYPGGIAHKHATYSDFIRRLSGAVGRGSWSSAGAAAYEDALRQIAHFRINDRLTAIAREALGLDPGKWPGPYDSNGDSDA